MEQKLVGLFLLLAGAYNLYKINKLKRPYFFFFLFIYSKKEMNFLTTIILSIVSILMFGVGIALMVSKKEILF